MRRERNSAKFEVYASQRSDIIDQTGTRRCCEVSEKLSHATSASCSTPVVSGVAGLESSIHQDKVKVHQAAEGLSSPIFATEVALPSKEYTGFNIPKSTGQRNKPAKAPRVSPKPNKRQPSSKSAELDLKDVRSPLQPKDLNRSESAVAHATSGKIVEKKEQNEAVEEIKTVVSLVSF